MRARPRVKLTASFCPPRPQIVTPALFRSARPVRAAFATEATPSSHTSQPPPPPPPTRWVSDVRARIGKCVSFGCDAAQTVRAAGIMARLVGEWHDLSFSSEGFLTAGRRGLKSQQVVWGEMDSFGHVNNTVYIRYAESARVNWILHHGVQDPKHRDAWNELMQPKSIGLIMQSIKADFKFPMTAPDTISAYHKLRICPDATHTSLLLDCVIMSHRHRRVAARTFEEVAIYDYREAKKTVLPTFMLDVLQKTWREQEHSTNWARKRIWDLLGNVERLEKETWDREDAVEDVGAATK